MASTTVARCSTCGNEYDKAFAVRTYDGSEYVFDSIECAVQQVAPECAHCGCRVLGHGVEADGSVYCCASCARRAGDQTLRDRA